MEEMSRTYLAGGMLFEGDVRLLFQQMATFSCWLGAGRALSGPSDIPADPAWPEDWQAVGRYVTVAQDGCRHKVFYFEAGQGIPVLCQHTAGNENRQWRHLLEDRELTKKYRFIAYDLPAHGKSDPPYGRDFFTEDQPLTSDWITRFVVALGGIGAAALALDTPLGAFAESVSPWARVGLRLIGVAVLALLAHGVWIAVRSVVDQRLASIGPIDPHQPPDASSRLLTLLPLLRVTTAVLLVVLLVLSSLWALGIEITPLLAGAGVLGIALGFGAQALVRDVIAGIFYLADDAFRVGEYIEGGGNTKGTVERITLRSVALRHHNGPLHFVPYGALGSVRNTSRDWVIDKFNLPLPIDVESEKIRKMIKRIGEEMKSDTALGQHIIEPLKGSTQVMDEGRHVEVFHRYLNDKLGKLYQINPGVKVFRCKFRSPPGKQFDIRAAALKRIEAQLKEMGVRFADGVSTVVVKG